MVVRCRGKRRVSPNPCREERWADQKEIAPTKAGLLTRITQMRPLPFSWVRRHSPLSFVITRVEKAIPAREAVGIAFFALMVHHLKSLVAGVITTRAFLPLIPRRSGLASRRRLDR